MNFLILISGVVLGIFICYLYYKSRINLLQSIHQKSVSDIELKHLEAINRFQIEESKYQEKILNFSKTIDALNKQLETSEHERSILNNKLQDYILDKRLLEEKLTHQKTEIEGLYQKFNTEFELIASKILKQNTSDLTIIHNKNISDLLNPLKEKIISFEKKVEETYDKELRDKVDLKAELKSLHELNKRISDEAHNLTVALKGDSKKQGNWGEIILERVLERSGLNKDQEYFLQFSTKNDEGKRIQPDVLIMLPEKKCLIIDAKVSLVAYEKFASAENETDRQIALKEHITSVKSHINGLSDKQYHKAEDIISPEFVLMFMPIESSFSTAIQADIELFNYAWDRRIVIVSPSTLLATLRTISSIWRQENQTKNAIEIARQSGNLFDKFVSFLADMERIGKGIENLNNTHQEALKKLSTGNGNLINRAEAIRKLGAKTSKSLPEKFTENNENIDEA